MTLGAIPAEEVVRRARQAKESFGTKCPKFAGAATVEILRDALTAASIPTSPRDVFVRGIPVEIDLIIPRTQQPPSLRLLYEPEQVAVAVEVKNSGSFGEGALRKVASDFKRLAEAGIRYVYVTFKERRDYRWAASTERLRFPCFTLALHRATGGPYEMTGEWDALVAHLRSLVEA